MDTSKNFRYMHKCIIRALQQTGAWKHIVNPQYVQNVIIIDTDMPIATTGLKTPRKSYLLLLEILSRHILALPAANSHTISTYTM